MATLQPPPFALSTDALDALARAAVEREHHTLRAAMDVLPTSENSVVPQLDLFAAPPDEPTQGLHSLSLGRRTIGPQIDRIPDRVGMRRGFLFLEGETLYELRTNPADPSGPDLLQPAILKDVRDTDRITLLVKLRDTGRRMLYGEQYGAPAADIDALRTELNTLYDTFRARYGAIRKAPAFAGKAAVKLPNLVGMERDDYSFLLNLEREVGGTGEFVKADLFTRSTVAPVDVSLRADTLAEAVACSMGHLHRVDLQFMADITGRTVTDLLQEGTQSGTLFFDPAERAWVDRDSYLSGDVRAKLRLAKHFAGHDPRLASNVVALEGILPPELTHDQITPALGAPWIPRKDINAFIRWVLRDVVSGTGAQLPESAFRGRRRRRGIAVPMPEVRRHPGSGRWKVDFPDGGGYLKVSEVRNWVRNHPVSKDTWGSGDRDFFDLVELALNQAAQVKVMRPRADNPTLTEEDPQASAIATLKLRRLEAEFARWIFHGTGVAGGEPSPEEVAAATERRERLVQSYNDQFATFVPKRYNVAQVSMPGVSADFTPLPHQLEAVSRVVQHGNFGMFWEVGSGKTAAGLMALMRMKQLGLANKPCYIALPATLEDVVLQAHKIYPNGRFLVGRTEDLTPDRIEDFAARVATSDVDIVIMAQPAFTRMPMSPAFMLRVLDEEHERLADKMADTRTAGEVTSLQKRMQKNREQHVRYTAMLDARRGDPNAATTEIALNEEAIEDALRRELALPADGADAGDAPAEAGLVDEKIDRAAARVFWEDLRIDALLVDEAHIYISGLGPDGNSGSYRSLDLEEKLQYHEQLTPGRNIILSTGTPFTTRTQQLHSIQRWLQRGKLIAQGMYNYADWHAVYGAHIPSYVWSPNGEPRMVVEPAGLKNAGDWFANIREVADLRGAEEFEIDRPSVRGGFFETVIVPQAPRQGELLEEAAARYTRLKAGDADTYIDGATGEERRDNVLRIYSYMQQTAMTARLVDPDVIQAPEHDKIETVIASVADIRATHEDTKATQLVISTGATTGGSGGFSPFHHIKQALVERHGWHPHEIAILSDVPSSQGLARVMELARRGEIRLVMGSDKRGTTGLNMQTRAKALHMLTIPYTAYALKQAMGRVHRQGNIHDEVFIFMYATEGTIDSFCAGRALPRLRMDVLLKQGDRNIREVSLEQDERVQALMDLEAESTGNPDMRRRAEIQKLLAELLPQAATYDQQVAGESRALEVSMRMGNFVRQWLAQGQAPWKQAPRIYRHHADPDRILYVAAHDEVLAPELEEVLTRASGAATLEDLLAVRDEGGTDAGEPVAKPHDATEKVDETPKKKRVALPKYPYRFTTPAGDVLDKYEDITRYLGTVLYGLTGRGRVAIGTIAGFPIELSMWHGQIERLFVPSAEYSHTCGMIQTGAGLWTEIRALILNGLPEWLENLAEEARTLGNLSAMQERRGANPYRVQIQALQAEMAEIRARLGMNADETNLIVSTLGADTPGAVPIAAGAARIA
jgi:N12 class adenine-specific DNA methylase